MHTKTILSVSVLTLLSLASHAGEPSPIQLSPPQPDVSTSVDLWSGGRPDGHAPIGVMADHMHKAGELMLSFRYMFMDMDTTRIGDDEISESRVILPEARGGEGFLVTPTDMQMHMYMAGAMYAPTDWATLLFMAPYVTKTMDHVRRDGVRFETNSEGFGDLKFGSLIKLFDAGSHTSHAGLVASAPTGSIDERDRIPAPGSRRKVDAQLPYPMQIGSGTWDLHPSLTYLGQAPYLSWGAQAGGVIRIDENDNGYTLGDRFDATAWAAVKMTDWLSASARVAYANWGDIDGRDEELATPSTVIPTADPDLRGGERLDLNFGLNVYVPGGLFRGHRIAAEIGFPLWEDLDGPQLGTDLQVTVGWQYAF